MLNGFNSQSKGNIESTINNHIEGRYDLNDVSVGVIGSHSALEIMDGAKEENLKTVCICQKGREIPYLKYKRLSDELMIVDRFSDILFKENQEKLLSLNTIMVPHRSFSVYIGYDNIENNLNLPIFGNRWLLKAEERNLQKNQYYLLEKAKIPHPKIYASPDEIDGPVIVKVQEAKRKLERAFFIATSSEDYNKKSQDRIDKGIIDAESLKGNSVIEQQNIEVGHTPASIRESLLENVFKMGEQFADSTKKEYPPGIIGPFSLQSVITPDLN